MIAAALLFRCGGATFVCLGYAPGKAGLAASALGVPERRGRPADARSVGHVGKHSRAGAIASRSDLEVRAEAIETLVDRKGEKATNSVLQMLTDPDGYVRARWMLPPPPGSTFRPINSGRSPPETRPRTSAASHSAASPSILKRRPTTCAFSWRERLNPIRVSWFAMKLRHSFVL
jgi:hypothetical protein